MKNLIIKSNNEVDDNLLDKVLAFDRTIFPSDEDYAFPDDYLKKIYQNSRDGIFVLLDNNSVVGYVNSIFLSDKAQEEYLKDRDYLSFESIGINDGDNNMYLYTLALKEEYRNSGAIKILMQSFANWLVDQRRKGKRIKSCISEAISEDGIRSLSIMGMMPYDIDDSGLGIYYSPDCLESYIEEMIKCHIDDENIDIDKQTTKKL